jgi:hypothetical protein
LEFRIFCTGNIRWDFSDSGGSVQFTYTIMDIFQINLRRQKESN